MITAQQLIAAGIGPTQAKGFVAPLNAAFQRFGIDTPRRIAAFLGQARVESLNFTHMEELLYYSTPERLSDVFHRAFPTPAVAFPFIKNPKALANRVYAGRNGNGDEASGDGWAFRGRGLFGLTGRSNYQHAKEDIGVDYVGFPDLVEQPEHACLTACWFWSTNKLNTLADANDIDQITRCVNGPAMLEASARRQFSQQALAALTV